MTMIYLLDEGGQPIGPFKNREDLDRFIKMMALCGEDWADRKVVEGEGDDVPGRDPAEVDSQAHPSKDNNRLKLVGRRS